MPVCAADSRLLLNTCFRKVRLKQIFSGQSACQEMQKYNANVYDVIK
jgi:hypothetical protein